MRTLNTVVGSQSKTEPILTPATQYSSPVESTLGIRISEREADLCCVAVIFLRFLQSRAHDLVLFDICKSKWTVVSHATIIMFNDSIPNTFST